MLHQVIHCQIYHKPLDSLQHMMFQKRWTLIVSLRPSLVWLKAFALSRRFHWGQIEIFNCDKPTQLIRRLTAYIKALDSRAQFLIRKAANSAKTKWAEVWAQNSVTISLDKGILRSIWNNSERDY
jgi:hypothetical protein